MTEEQRQQRLTDVFAALSECLQVMASLNKCPVQSSGFREGQRVRHKRNGDRGTVTSDGIRRDGDSYSSAWIQSDWELDV